NITLQSDNKITNYNTIYAKANINIGGYTSASSLGLLENLTTSKDKIATIKAGKDIKITAAKIENKGFDIWGNSAGFTVATEHYHVNCHHHINLNLASQQVATSTISTANSSIFAGGNIAMEGNVLNHGGDIIAGQSILIQGNLENKVTTTMANG